MEKFFVKSAYFFCSNKKYKTNFYSLNKGIISDFSCKKDKKMI